MLVPWKVGKGERIYAIGDIHGRMDLFAQLLSALQQDNATRPRAKVSVVVLGDIVDRGPGSAELITRMMRYTQASKRFIVLKGNHEQIMLAALSGDQAAGEEWIKYGGEATLASWGVPEQLIADGPRQTVFWQARQCIGPEVLRWMSALKVQHRSGDVLFVHAGIRPGVAVAKQDPLDMMWIRQDFLEDETIHPVLVVHGHNVFESGLDRRPNRIGVDTGAYRTGRLTALGLEADRTWSISTA